MRSQYGLRRLVAVALVLFALPAFAGVGIITHLSGVLTAKRADGTSKVLGIKSEVEQGDTLTTEADTYARIKFVDGAEVVLRPGTQFKIEKYAYTEGAPDSDNIIVSMFKGGLRAVTGLIGKRNKEKSAFRRPRPPSAFAAPTSACSCAITIAPMCPPFVACRRQTACMSMSPTARS